MSWTMDRDTIFCREIMVSRLFETKKSSVERGQVWEAIADHLSSMREPTFKVDQRAVRDHYKKLITRFKRKQREELSASGISPEETELDSMMEEIVEREESSEIILQHEKEEKMQKLEEDRIAADDMRRKAMETLSETKKRKGKDGDKLKKKKKCTSETLTYLREKSASEINVRREEIELKKADNELKATQLEQQNNMMKVLVEQQQQQQQQNQAMHVMMLQQQQQQTQALLALIEKIVK